MEPTTRTEPTSHVVNCDGCGEYRPCNVKVLLNGDDRDCLYLCEECYYKF